MAEKEQVLEEQKQNNSQLETEIQEAEDQLQQECEKLNTQVSTLKTEVKNGGIQIAELEKKLQELENQSKVEREQLQRTAEKNRAASNGYQDQLEEQQTKAAEAENQLKYLQSQLDQLNGRLAELTTEIQALKDERNKLDQEKQAADRQHTETENQLKDQLAVQREQFNTASQESTCLRAELEAKELSHQQLTRRCQETEKALSDSHKVVANRINELIKEEEEEECPFERRSVEFTEDSGALSCLLKGEEPPGENELRNQTKAVEAEVQLKKLQSQLAVNQQEYESKVNQLNGMLAEQKTALDKFDEEKKDAERQHTVTENQLKDQLAVQREQFNTASQVSTRLRAELEAKELNLQQLTRRCQETEKALSDSHKVVANRINELIKEEEEENVTLKEGLLTTRPCVMINS